MVPVDSASDPSYRKSDGRPRRLAEAALVPSVLSEGPPTLPVVLTRSPAAAAAPAAAPIRPARDALLDPSLTKRVGGPWDLPSPDVDWRGLIGWAWSAGSFVGGGCSGSGFRCRAAPSWAPSCSVGKLTPVSIMAWEIVGSCWAAERCVSGEEASMVMTLREGECGCQARADGNVERQGDGEGKRRGRMGMSTDRGMGGHSAPRVFFPWKSRLNLRRGSYRVTESMPRHSVPKLA